VALAPMTFALGHTEELLECKCTHGDHTMCPMHHKPAPGSKICVMTSTGDSAVVFSWLLNVGLVPAPFESVVPERQHVRLIIDVTTASLRPAPPDPPPPRL
jgi:hypothetical protein